MASITDKRFTPKDGAVINRQKFLKRYRAKIKEAVKQNIANQSIKDFKFNGQKVKIKGIDGGLDLPEPALDSKRGVHGGVSVGNKTYNKGDLIKKPPSGQGKGQGGGNGSGSDDDYEFTLSEKEFTDLFFEDLELPAMEKKKFLGENFEVQRAGFSNRGSPSSLNMFQTMKRALVRILALQKEDEDLIEAGEEVLIKPEDRFVLDETDLKYNYRTKVSVPSSKAVMFCLMDVSGSMGSTEKDIAKRFFILLNRFLRKNYAKVDVVFIRHAEWAEECDENTFFYGRESGGTVISTGYARIIDIAKERYNPEQWNIYIAQATDGDNFDYDNDTMVNILGSYLLPIVQYFSFIEIGSSRQRGMRSNVFELLKKMSEVHRNLSVKAIEGYDQIFDIFRQIFAREGK